MKPSLTAREHYDRLAESGHGLDDPPFLQEFMARWDGPLFWKAIGDTRDKDILEVGIGLGRIARQVLKQGCCSLTGLDISPRTIAAARSHLSEFSNLELIVGDINEFCRPASFDMIYSVLTFMHVQDKRKALQNMVECLRPGGRILLSIDKASDLLNVGEWTVTLHPWAPELYAEVLSSSGCEAIRLIPLIDTWVGPEGEKQETHGEQLATLVEATRS